MLALATTRQGDIPLYLHALDGNASDKVSLVEAVEALGEQLQAEGETPIFVADSGMYSRENMARLNTAHAALDLPVLRRDQSAHLPPTGRPSTPGRDGTRAPA